MGRYERPSKIADAAVLLSEGHFTLLAGGTDFYPARVGGSVEEDVLDLTALEDLRGIEEQAGHWRLGALTTWTDLTETQLPPLFDGYKAAAREVGGSQIQNTGTLAGNLCNASPAADGTPNLLALDAVIELQSSRGQRRMPVSRFVRGNRQTLRQDDEIVTALLVPKPGNLARSVFRKLGARKYLVISIVMVAAVIEETRDGRVAAARIAVGSCNAVAQRLMALEAALTGQPVRRLADVVKAEHLAPLAPIDDVRGTATYRSKAALELIRRTLQDFA
jgi:CO/xanthine dehydrogenase FAD-binding subunit